jgi:leucyl-tRNA synthetase
VLANEQVIDGRGWRSGAVVEKREIPGYYLKITQYAQELLEHVQHHLPGWPERVKLMQENWIGRSEGVRFAFPHDIRDGAGALVQDGRLHVFTTRADTIMGVTFCAVAPEHPLATHAARSSPEVAAFVEACKAGGTTEAELATQEKKGVRTGLQVTHPLTGEAVDVWVGNYVLIGYGDGAVMGVPGHDERDFAFALKYGIPIVQVVQVDGEPHYDYTRWQEWYADKSRGVVINSGSYSGLAYQAAVDAIAHDLAARDLGEKKTTWRLRDWGISRQRYWGTPIPIIHCPEHGAVPVPESDLPVVLPEDCIPDGSGNPLNKRADFLACKCPVCGADARRETDTMDTFVDSSWYYMRYCDPHLDGAMVGDGTRYWMPMDQYIGGIEHAILHLLYARFWTKVMRDLDLVQVDEPFTKLLTQGMVLNHIYSRRGDKGGIEYFWPHEVENTFDASGKVVGARLKADKGELPAGTAVDYEGVGTMSKSKNNGVDPQELIDRYGADTARLFVMFASPPEQTLEWNDAGVEGAHRFLRRLWGSAARLAPLLQRATSDDLSGAALREAAKGLRREVHLVLRQVSYDYERMQYNTVVSGCMKLLNALEAFDTDGSDGDAAVLAEGVSVLLRALYPACPHVTWVLWRDLGFARAAGELLDAPWPHVDESALVQDEVELVLQVNGKHRGVLRVPAQAGREQIEQQAADSPEVQRFAEGRPIRKIVVVPGRLVNVVA